MKLDKDHINSIIHGNSRFFLDLFRSGSLLYVYCKGYTEDFEEKIIDIYYDKLRYAVQNAEKLVNEMFREEFYDFYGVDKNAVSSPEQMKTELVFDSFYHGY